MPWFNEIYSLLVRFHFFFMGAACALSLTASLLFLRFYRKTSDRLFLFFSAAFGLMALNRIVFQMANPASESQPVLYIARLVAFCLILYAIIDKNRAGRKIRGPL